MPLPARFIQGNFYSIKVTYEKKNDPNLWYIYWNVGSDKNKWQEKVPKKAWYVKPCTFS